LSDILVLLIILFHMCCFGLRCVIYWYYYSYCFTCVVLVCVLWYIGIISNIVSGVLVWLVLYDILVLLLLLFQVCWFGLWCLIYWYYF